MMDQREAQLLDAPVTHSKNEAWRLAQLAHAYLEELELNNHLMEADELAGVDMTPDERLQQYRERVEECDAAELLAKRAHTNSVENRRYQHARRRAAALPRCHQFETMARTDTEPSHRHPQLAILGNVRERQDDRHPGGTAAMAKGIKQVVFDRGGARYHGKVKALADAAREAGLQF